MSFTCLLQIPVHPFGSLGFPRASPSVALPPAPSIRFTNVVSLKEIGMCAQDLGEAIVRPGGGLCV